MVAECTGIMDGMKVQDFDFQLPDSLIAQFPAGQRADSRLLHLDGVNDRLQDDVFARFPQYLRPGDVLVFNNTRVIKARLHGRKESGGKVEVMIERVLDERHALAMIRASHAPAAGTVLWLADAITVRVLKYEDGFCRLQFEHECPVSMLLERYGSLPLPPYISRQAVQMDESRYQTVYASEPGAVAAPTAGLHFDEVMLAVLRAQGIALAEVTLHVGAGTFQPVRVEDITEHRMHKERFYIPEATAETVRCVRAAGGRVVAIGTTSLRALESAVTEQGEVRAGHGETDIFITPGYRFRVVERLLTNFHLPRSTLLMLVSAFAGMENIRQAYHHAVENSYRFFSYGDAMLIERKI